MAQSTRRHDGIDFTLTRLLGLVLWLTLITFVPGVAIMALV